MLDKIIHFSLKNKLIVGLMVLFLTGMGIYSIFHIPIGAVPDITNNQVQVITTSRNLSTVDVEQFITTPVELEMANLPGVKEIRSISKFGLSVVTIVFKEDMGTFLPRQLIAEKLASVSDKIPSGFGKPFMGPVTTGLGEVYQYILDTKPEYKDQYSIMELRTIQDWVVKRQLSGIPGVVEVNTWGGQLKQYEVALFQERLNSLNLSIEDVFIALESNNSITGGGYIEKNNKSYFIRGEGLLTGIKDIEQVVVANSNGIPILVKDVAQVKLGSAIRFGAITANGEGEKVMGQIMMLKDANSNEVMAAIKTKVAEAQKTLPEGVFINPILERSELIEKTTFTVTENLVLGFLIVLFVVVLMLGSWRSGLVVASVIPLCLFFALSLMYLFGIDANLMSLGAIDFGIIIDGAVIIVEYIAFKLTKSQALLQNLSKEEMLIEKEKITKIGASKMMNSAVFGQLIIIIVFIPILTLSDVEGKMFVPMALAFCFALLGAMLLCFTYVPVVSALLLKPEKMHANSINKRMMRVLERVYRSAITWALGHKKIVLGTSLLLVLFTGILFSKMGGEFVPTLDEGDFVIQPVLKTGTSLSKTMEITTKIEKILATFPEVEQTVSRIGAAEVPTDPMSMEESDVIIKLKPKKSWTSASSKDALANAFKKRLKSIPGIDFEFTQPIEMRFNELITGVKADLAIKIFGEDLNVLASKAEQIKKQIEHVEGAADISVEKVEGLPQMTVKLKRKALARYGLNAKDVNNAIETAFAGRKAGVVFEGERRFDLVLRNLEKDRTDITHLANTYVSSASGLKVPINQVAEIGYTKGPAKISRDETKRRIVIGVNVRNRDLESVVVDIQNLIDNNINLPPGYYMEYGGQFKNLQNASNRLLVVVPVALLLIFVLLYFALGGVKEAVLVFTAIPLSAVGGVLFLYLRDLPFSISAGVGFIALFGIAVLNGIVLIEEFKELKKSKNMELNERIITGTIQRLRPVLLTAMAAAMGFLPMAISTLAGAEVQRPLATVVIGGLFTATVLTLFVLPILYSIIEGRKPKLNSKFLFLIAFILVGNLALAQNNKPISLNEAINIAMTNNKLLKQDDVKIKQAQIQAKGSYALEKTSIYYNQDANNIAENGLPLKVWGVQQSVAFPTVYSKTKKLNNTFIKTEQAKKRITQLELKKQVTEAYYGIVYAQKQLEVYRYLDSLYSKFAYAAKRRYQLGETNQLESFIAESKFKEHHAKLLQAIMEVETRSLDLNRWLQAKEPYTIVPQEMFKLKQSNVDSNTSPTFQLISAYQIQNKAQLQLSKQELLPDLQVSYFQGTNQGIGAKIYSGFEVGVAVPLFYGAQKAKVKSAKLSLENNTLQKEQYAISFNARRNMLLKQLDSRKINIDLYTNSNNKLAQNIAQFALRSYEAGELDYLVFIQSLEQAKNIEFNYLASLWEYNKIIINLQYLN